MKYVEDVADTMTFRTFPEAARVAKRAAMMFAAIYYVKVTRNTDGGFTAMLIRRPKVWGKTSPTQP